MVDGGGSGWLVHHLHWIAQGMCCVVCYLNVEGKSVLCLPEDQTEASKDRPTGQTS